jgi:hypothetical protein
MRVRYPTREGILRDEAETVGGLRLIGVCAEDEACLVHWVPHLKSGRYSKTRPSGADSLHVQGKSGVAGVVYC